MPNELETYAIVDEDNKVVEYFRTKFAAMELLVENQGRYFEKLKVVKLK